MLKVFFHARQMGRSKKIQAESIKFRNGLIIKSSDVPKYPLRGNHPEHIRDLDSLLLADNGHLGGLDETVFTLVI
jgi:hypothetical protein